MVAQIILGIATFLLTVYIHLILPVIVGQDCMGLYFLLGLYWQFIEDF